jgi:hypothetical protein
MRMECRYERRFAVMDGGADSRVGIASTLYYVVPDDVDEGGYGDRQYDDSLGSHARSKMPLVYRRPECAFKLQCLRENATFAT